MSLIGNIIAEAIRGNPSIINYTMFVSVFSMLSLFYLGAIAFNEGFTGHSALPLALDVLNTIFFFCGAVALSADLRVHSCNNRVCFFCPIYEYTLTSCRITFSAMVSPTVQPTLPSVATKPRHRPLSYGSALHATLHPWSSVYLVHEVE